MLALNTIHCGNALGLLRQMEPASVHTCVTSPPYYGLRDYGNKEQIGMEPTPELYIANLVEVFRELRRVLRDDGTFWLNIGDSYMGSGKVLYGDGQSHGTEGAKQKTNAGSIGVSDNRMGTHSTLQGGKNNQRNSERAHEHIASANCKPKDLIGIPWMLAFALRSDGWYLRQDIIWAKKNPMPESVTDRCTKSHEYLFLLSKSPRYYYDQDAIREKLKPSSIARLAQPTLEDKKGSERVPGKTNGNMKAVRFGGDKQCPDTRLQSGKEWTPRTGGSGFTPEARNTVGAETGTANKRSVWFVSTQGFKEAHFATFPPKLIVPCIQAGSPEGGVVLDPFMGAGTTALVAKKLLRNYIGIELNAEYIAIAEKRLLSVPDSLFDGGAE